jgi:hypothetical protein
VESVSRRMASWGWHQSERVECSSVEKVGTWAGKEEIGLFEKVYESSSNCFEDFQNFFCHSF